jgi:hypothetical protein
MGKMIKIKNMINKTVLKLVICILTAIFTSCDRSGYKKIDGKMYHYTWNYQTGDHKREVKGADLATFKVNKEYGDYATDKNHIYFFGNVIDADINTFKIIKSKGSFATDKRHVFHGSQILQDADPLTFQIVDENRSYVRDATHVYLHSKLLEGADPATFRFLDEKDEFYSYMKDVNHVYSRYNYELITVIEGAEIGTFQLLGNGYTKDANHVYYDAKQIPEVDIKTFVFDGKNYTRDSSNIYYHDRVLEDIDRATFRLLYPDSDDLDGWCCDKKAYYFKGEKITGIDYDTFEIFNEGDSGYAKDKYYVYYCGDSRRDDDKFALYVGKVEGADPETFELVGKYKHIGKDKYGYYIHEKNTPKHRIHGLE